MPRPCPRRDTAACDELDEHVAALRWSDAALEYGSKQRMMVAVWLRHARIVDDAMRRLYPQPGKRERMTQWVTVRIVEKILGRPIESNANAWNWSGLWNPLMRSSFCGWARDLASVVAKGGQRRILSNRTAVESDLVRDAGDDGYDPMVDRADSSPLTMGVDRFDPFLHYPGLMVPRPTGRTRLMLNDLMLAHGPEETMTRAREIGVWHHSLDPLDPGVAAALLLQPLTMSAARVLPRLDVHGMPVGLLERYAPTQTARMTRRPDALLRRMVDGQAEARHVAEATVWLELGTAAARLLAV